MKEMKRIVALILAAAMIFSLGMTAFASQGQAGKTDGSVTVTNAKKGETYTLYKVFDLTYEGEAVAYTFTKTADNAALYAALMG